VNDIRTTTASPDRTVTARGRHRRRCRILVLLRRRASAPRHLADRHTGTPIAHQPVQRLNSPTMSGEAAQAGTALTRRARGRRAQVFWWAVRAALVCALMSVVMGRPAAALTSAPLTVGPVLAVDDLETVVDRATAWLIGILATVATFFLTLGGAKYLAAGGDPSEVERAKTSLKNAGVGYALALLAPVILDILQAILGVS
jgi:hypothetical protein